MSDNKCKIITNNILILISFMILSIVSFSILIKTNFIFGGWDIHFHISRALELYQSIRHGVIFPFSDFNYFHGNLTMLMYPYINLYPLILFFYLFKSYCIAIYAWFVLNIFLSLVISFYSSYSTYYSRELSYLFAILYSMSGFLFSICISYMDWGLMSAYISLPLVIFGYINYLKNQNKWAELSTGMSLLVLSHVLSAVIILGLLLILSLLNIRHLIRYKIKNILTPVILIVCITSIYWVPLIYSEICNRGNINPPAPSILNGYNSQIVLASFHLQPLMGIDVIAWVTVVIALFYYRHFSRIIKQLYIIACLTLIICSDLIPWPKISSYFPKITIIQKVYRFYIIPQVILLLILALIITKYVKWHKLLVMALIVFAIFVQVQDQIQFVNSKKNEPILNSRYIKQHKYDLFDLPQNFKLCTNYDFNLLSNWLNSKDDYFPKDFKSFKNVHNNIVRDNNQTAKWKRIGFNRFDFTINKAGHNIQLPLILFRGQHIKILINHHVRSTYNSHNQVDVSYLPPGKYIVQVSLIKNIKLIWSIIILTLMGIFIYLGMILRKVILSKSKQIKTNDEL